MPFHGQGRDKHSGGGGGDSFWTSYSDLFLGMSSIFLLLYVVGSLRSGTTSIKQQIDNEQLKLKVSELETQIKFYEQSKNEYLAKTENKDEVAEYQELMDKITLLQEEAKSENDQLHQQMVENNSKVKALNKYQQMIRNVINASKFEKIKVGTRDEIIEENVAEIGEQKNKIASLQTEIQLKQNELKQSSDRIKQASLALQQQQNQLVSSLNQQKITRKVYEQKLANMRQQSALQISELKKQEDLQKQQLAGLSNQIQTLNQEVGGLSAHLDATKGELSAKQGELNAKQGELAATKGELSATKQDLARAQAEIEDRKAIAKNIKQSFAKNGVKADIDMETGEVFLDFGDNYFETNSANLKLEMKKVIDQAFPTYIKALMGNQKIAKKISTVEIVGFASPTYKGRFIDPNSSNKADQEALKYNMDLSYNRAKSIFSYVLNSDIASSAERKKIIPLLKVSGRSFLDTSHLKRNVATAEFCKVNDCKKSQRVVIRFNVDQKKDEEK